MAVLVTVGVIVAVVLIAALAMDFQDRRNGRKSRVRTAAWVQRAGRVSMANSPEGYLADMKGIGNTYSGDALRGDPPKQPLSD